MIINHPLLGPHDSSEFVYLGDASLIGRPDPDTVNEKDWHDYAYLRDNPAGLHRQLMWCSLLCHQMTLIIPSHRYQQRIRRLPRLKFLFVFQTFPANANQGLRDSAA